ncbi:MAG: hypothetical protein ACOYL5_13465 [Phototrophicaceae bacterium]
MLKKFLIFVLFALLTSIGLVAAQTDTCTPAVEQALSATAENCAGLTRNTVCYGYDHVEASFVEPVTEGFFSLPAERAEIRNLSSIITAPWDEVTGEWGVAVMSVQANLPETLPGQNVVFLLFGDTQLTNAADAVIPEGQEAARPMQAFYFTTGIGLSNCKEAPDQVVIQSPGRARVTLNINGADVQLGSTAVISFVEPVNSEDPLAFELTMLDGEAIINDQMQVPEGHWAQIPLDFENPMDEATGLLAVRDELPFCRPIPDEQMANFQALADSLPESLLNYDIDVIEHAEGGCMVLDGE